jgi:hypothetical protein
MNIILNYPPIVYPEPGSWEDYNMIATIIGKIDYALYLEKMLLQTKSRKRKRSDGNENEHDHEQRSPNKKQKLNSKYKDDSGVKRVKYGYT